MQAAGGRGLRKFLRSAVFHFVRWKNKVVDKNNQVILSFFHDIVL